MEPDPQASTRARVLERLASPGFRFAVLVLLVLVVVIVTVTTGGVGVDDVRSWVDGAGVSGPIVFALVYLVAATLLLPAAPFTIAAGLLFGPVLGTVTALVGATAGATGAFFVGRGLGRGAVQRFGGDRVAAVDRFVAERGFSAVLLIRLVPLFPFNVINVAAGTTGILVRDFVLATAIGIVPGTVVYAALGGTVDDPTSPAFLGAVAAFVVITVLTGFAARRLRHRGAVPDPP